MQGLANHTIQIFAGHDLRADLAEHYCADQSGEWPACLADQRMDRRGPAGRSRRNSPLC